MRNSWSHVPETHSIQCNVSASYCAFSFSYFKCVELFSIFLLPVNGCWTPWYTDTFRNSCFNIMTNNNNRKQQYFISIELSNGCNVYMLLCKMENFFFGSNELFAVNNTEKNSLQKRFSQLHSFDTLTSYISTNYIDRVGTFIVIDWLGWYII